MMGLIYHNTNPETFFAQPSNEFFDRQVVFSRYMNIAIILHLRRHRLPRCHEDVAGPAIHRLTVFGQLAQAQTRQFSAKCCGRLAGHALERREPEPHDPFRRGEFLRQMAGNQRFARACGRLQQQRSVMPDCDGAAGQVRSCGIQQPLTLCEHLHAAFNGSVLKRFWSSVVHTGEPPKFKPKRRARVSGIGKCVTCPARTC